MQAKHVIVIGGSVAGLGVALALSARGHRVTVLEADATPLPDSHSEAFEKWDRKGSPQARQSHALLAPLHNRIRDHAPDLLDELKACGAEELRFMDRARQLFDDPEFEDGDEDMVFLACRRMTFEWVLRRHVLDTRRVEFLDGAEVLRLEALADEASGRPRVTGVWAKLGDEVEKLVEGDLVVDASGRRSPLRRWLPEIGAAPIREESSPCGIFYTSRFYRLLDGAEPPPLDGGIVGVDLGFLKVGLFAGDSRVFSITLAASPQDDEIRGVLHRPAFDTAVAKIPLLAGWANPEISEPVSDVHGMANLNNTRRFFVEEGEPLALGVIPVGDSLIHTNPISGRGCSLAWTSAFALADCIEANPDDLRALALAYEEHVERDVVPWYELQVSQDTDAIEVAETQRRGEDPYQATLADGTPNPKGHLRSLLRDGLGPALQEDFRLLRHFMRTVHMLDGPGEMIKNPEVIQSLMASYAKRDEREKIVLGPSRSEMAELFAALDAGAGS